MDHDQWHGGNFLSQQPPDLGNIDRSVTPSTTESAMERSRRTTRRITQQPDRLKPTTDTKRDANVIDVDDGYDQHVEHLSYDDGRWDTEYRESPSRPRSSTKERPKKVYPKDLTYEELLKAYFELEQNKKDTESTLKEIRAKRTEDPKDGASERAQRIKLQDQRKQLEEDKQALRQQLARQKVDFDAASQQQKNEFARAQEDWIAKINMQKYPCLPDNILQNKFQELYNKCRD